ncbi:hypothetical protein [Methylocella sp.]|uniref:hypothetical protein n=1 Tax=Methylocella sp. TaxID=1978226 RepID=UPI003C1B92A1
MGGEFNDRLERSRLWEQMSCAQYDLKRLLALEAVESPLIEFDHAGILTTDDQKRRRLDPMKRAIGEIRAAAAGNDRSDALSERSRCDQGGGCAGARPEQSDGEALDVGFAFDPAHRIDQPLREKADVEDVSTVFVFARQQKVEQERRNTAPIQSLRDQNIAWTEAAGATAMSENDQSAGIDRPAQHASQAKRRNPHFPLARRSEFLGFPRISAGLSELHFTTTQLRARTLSLRPKTIQ